MLQQLLFEPSLVRSPLRIVQWWERRRLAYNAVVGVLGLGSLGYAMFVSYLARGAVPTGVWQLALAYGLAANVCYTLGPATEILADRWLKRPLYGLGPALFRHGLVFSIGLTLFPAAMVTFFAIAGWFFR